MGLGIFSLYSSNYSTKPDSVHDIAFLNGIGKTAITKDTSAYSSIYYTTAEYNKTAANDVAVTGWDSETYSNIWLPSAYTLPDISEGALSSFWNSYSELYTNYTFKIDLANDATMNGSNYFYNTDSDFLKSYFKYKLVDKSGSAIQPGDKKFGLYVKDVTDNVVSNITSFDSYLNIGSLSNNKFDLFDADINGTSTKVPSRSIGFNISTSEEANVTVIASNSYNSSSYVGVYKRDSIISNDTAVTSIGNKPDYAMYLPKGQYSNKTLFAFDYDSTTGVTSNVVTPAGSITTQNKLFAHTFKLPKGQYYIGSPNNGIKIYYIAAQGQENANAGIGDKIYIGSNSIGTFDFLLYDPEGLGLNGLADDETWISMVMDIIPRLEKITRVPKMNIKNIGNVVPVELSRRINSESVQHLASHSQFVKEVKANGDIVPSKILNVEAQDDFKLYENRFVMTLISRLFIFVEKRYDYILKYAPLKDYETLYIKNKSKFNGGELETETKVSFSRNSVDKNNTDSYDYFKKILFIRKYARYFMASDFMKLFVHEKDIRLPIVQTNVIRKNPDYHACYKLFTFLNGYSELGVEFMIDEKYKDFSKVDIDNINNSVLINLLTLEANSSVRDIKEKKRKVKPKILSTIDDEVFTFENHDTDVELVRVDKAYLDFKTTVDTPKNLKLHPKKDEQIAREKEYIKKKEVQNNLKRVEELKKRKEKAARLYNKHQEEYLERLEREKQEQIAANKKAQEKAALYELNRIRSHI